MKWRHVLMAVAELVRQFPAPNADPAIVTACGAFADELTRIAVKASSREALKILSDAFYAGCDRSIAASNARLAASEPTS